METLSNGSISDDYDEESLDEGYQVNRRSLPTGEDDEDENSSINEENKSNVDEELVKEVTETQGTEEDKLSFNLAAIVDLPNLVKLRDQMREMLQLSEMSLKHFSDSTRYMEQTCDLVVIPTQTLIGEVARLNRLSINMGVVLPQIQEFSRVLELVEGDKLKIKQGPRTTIGEYIEKLAQIRAFDRFAWVNAIEYKIIADAFSREKTLKQHYNDYLMLMDKGEKILVQEFIGTLDFYSSDGRMLSYFEFIMNNFNEDDQIECTKVLLKEIDTPQTVKSSLDKHFLFISNESAFKMAKICSWFLERENDSELYDDNHEHIDIHGKLSFAKMRFEFLRNALLIHAKMASLGYKRDLNESFKKNFNKILNTVSSTKSIISQLAKSRNDIQSPQSAKVKPTFEAPKYNMLSSLSMPQGSSKRGTIFSPGSGSNVDQGDQETSIMDTLDFEDVPLKDPANTRPIEFLELYLEDLNFNLRLLLHEAALIEIVFHKSDETQSQLMSQLKSLFIDVVHKELEKFFENKLDLAKISPLDDGVVVLVVLLLSRVNRIRDKLMASKFDDIQSSTKLLRFTMKTSEICAPIFQVYLNTIKRDAGNSEINLPSDFGLHSYVIKICTVWRAICRNEVAVANAIQHGLIQLESSGGEKEKTNDEQSKQQERTFSRLMSKTKMLNFDVFSFRKPLNKAPSVDSQENETELVWYLGKYYLMIIQRLEKYLLDESLVARMVIMNGNTSRFTILGSSQNLPSNFRTELGQMKLNVFLANNFQFIHNFIQQMQLADTMRNFNPDFETEMVGFIESIVDQSSDVFKSVVEKWKSLPTLLSPNATSEATEADALDELNEQITTEINQPNEPQATLKQLTSPKEHTKKSKFSFGAKIMKSLGPSGKNAAHQNQQNQQQQQQQQIGQSKIKLPTLFGKSDSKQREQFLLMVGELIASCALITVIGLDLSQMLQRKLAELGFVDVLKELETSGELGEVLENIGFKFRAPQSDELVSVADRVVNEMFFFNKT